MNGTDTTANSPQIEGLPPGAVVRPISKPKITGLPEGAVVKPIKTTASVTKSKQERKPTAGQSTQKFFENHPVVRELGMGALSGLGIPESSHPVWDMLKGLKSTITDPPKTKDEIAYAAIGGASLPLYRIAKGIVQQTYGYGQEMFDSIDWAHIGDEIKKNKGLKDADLRVFKEGSGGAPQFAHGVAGLATVIATILSGGKKKFPKPRKLPPVLVKKWLESFKEGPTTAAQRMAGTGPKLAKEVAESAVEEHATTSAKAVETSKAWAEKVAAAKKSISEAATVEGKREALQSAQKTYVQRIMDNVKETHTVVRKSLDERWNQLREAVGVDHPVKAPSIYQSIEQSRAMLAGVPADLKIFNDLVKEITEKGEQVETESGDLQNVPKESIPFDDARTQFSAVGEKAYAADGNLRRALFNVYEAYDKALSATAVEAGQGKVYAALKNDWKRYMQDWHDMRSMATGGSPLARLYRAVDLPVVAANVLGKFGDRLFGTFARYRTLGADPALLGTVRRLSKEEQALPKAKATKMPARPESSAVAIPKPPNFDDIIKKTQEAKIEQAEKTREQALTLSKHDFTLGLISGISAFGLHSWSYAVPYVLARAGEAVLVSSEMGQRWLSQVTPADIKAINEVLAKSPDKTPMVQQAITNGLIDQAKQGKPLPPLSTFSGLLTRAQLGLILRVIAPPKQSSSTRQPVTSSVP